MCMWYYLLPSASTTLPVFPHWCGYKPAWFCIPQFLVLKVGGCQCQKLFILHMSFGHCCLPIPADLIPLFMNSVVLEGWEMVFYHTSIHHHHQRHVQVLNGVLRCVNRIGGQCCPIFAWLFLLPILPIWGLLRNTLHTWELNGGPLLDKFLLGHHMCKNQFCRVSHAAVAFPDDIRTTSTIPCTDLCIPSNFFLAG